MNFAFMPELHWKWSYPVVLAAMVVIEIYFLFPTAQKERQIIISNQVAGLTQGALKNFSAPCV